MAESTTTNVYASAEQHFLAGELDKAKQELQDALKVDDNAGRLWELLGMVLYTQGDCQQAVNALEHGSLLVPLSNCSRFILALCYEKGGQEESSRTILQFLASVEDLEAHLLEPLARALGRCDDCKGALRVCTEASRRMPQAGEPLMGMVFYMQRLNRPGEEILPVLFRAHHLNPEDTDCRVALAWLLHELGRTTEAAYMVSQIPFQQMTCSSCLNRIRQILLEAEDHESLAKCISALQRIEEL